MVGNEQKNYVVQQHPLVGVYMWKNLLALSVLIATITICLKSIQPVQAQQGPNVSLGSNPIKNFYGYMTVPSNQHTSLYSNTSGQDFIVTTAYVNHRYCTIAVDGNVVYPDEYTISINIFDENSGIDSVFRQGRARLLVPNGSELQLFTSYTNNMACYYYLEGYYVHP